METKPKPTRRQKLRAKTFPDDKGAQLLAALLGVHLRTIYRFEAPGNDKKSPANPVIRKAYEDLIKNGPPATTHGQAEVKLGVTAGVIGDKIKKHFMRINR
jgi:hypothetical protein